MQQIQKGGDGTFMFLNLLKQVPRTHRIGAQQAAGALRAARDPPLRTKTWRGGLEAVFLFPV